MSMGPVDDANNTYQNIWPAHGFWNDTSNHLNLKGAPRVRVLGIEAIGMFCSVDLVKLALSYSETAYYHLSRSV